MSTIGTQIPRATIVHVAGGQEGSLNKFGNKTPCNRETGCVETESYERSPLKIRGEPEDEVSFRAAADQLVLETVPVNFNRSRVAPRTSKQVLICDEVAELVVYAKDAVTDRVLGTLQGSKSVYSRISAGGKAIAVLIVVKVVKHQSLYTDPLVR